MTADLLKVREHLLRLAKQVTRPERCGFQIVRRDRNDGRIEYQIFADNEPNGTQIAYVQSSRHDAEFISACLAQAPLFDALLASVSRPPSPSASATEKRLERVRELMPRVLSTTVVIVPEGDSWIVGAKEYDCVSYGPTRKQAILAFRTQFACDLLLHADPAIAPVAPMPDDVWSELSARQGAEAMTFAFVVAARPEGAQE